MEKYRIITLSYTSAKPYTMVVETKDTIVAVVAMRSSEGTKNIACFTIFYFRNVGISAN